MKPNPRYMLDLTEEQDRIYKMAAEFEKGLRKFGKKATGRSVTNMGLVTAVRMIQKLSAHFNDKVSDGDLKTFAKRIG